MQTFLPYSDFGRSAAALDRARLGKQRVEVLQILRALTFPSYGWTNHPATLMWRGYVPALVGYGLSMVEEWQSRGAADSTRTLIAEFAPEAVGVAQSTLAAPSWLGNPALHRSHQSNLIRKLPEFYGPQFPGVPDDLEYVWPGSDALPPSAAVPGVPLLVIRPRDDGQLDDWVRRGEIELGETSPTGRIGPKWQAQREHFRSLAIGTRFAAPIRSGQSLRLGTVESDYFLDVDEGTDPLERSVRHARFDGFLDRECFPYPALLQDPRTLFETTGPVL